MEKMEHLFSSWELKGHPIKNRICVPPLVIYTWGDDTGKVTEKSVRHYNLFTHGGAGLVIQEATSVLKKSRITPDQLGIWEDGQIEGLSRLAAEFHKAGMPAILQLSHAGILSEGRENQVSPSFYECYGNRQERVGRELTVPEIHEIEQAFIDGARRAYEAGYDGAELHACHGYLLSGFLNARINRREDEYNAADLLILKNIIEGIRRVTPPEFILGIRLGAFEPAIEDGIAHAKWLEQQGVDFIDAYVGSDWEMDMKKPEDFPFNESIYGAMRLKQAVNVPVFAALRIRTGEEAEAILRETGVDAVVIGRATLTNYRWGEDVAAGRDPGRCMECPVCLWQIDPNTCPGRKRLADMGKLEMNI